MRKGSQAVFTRAQAYSWYYSAQLYGVWGLEAVRDTRPPQVAQGHEGLWHWHLGACSARDGTPDRTHSSDFGPPPALY